MDILSAPYKPLACKKNVCNFFLVAFCYCCQGSGLDKLREMSHKVSILTQAFFTLKWFSTTEIMTPPIATV